jgi:hypothetical protein
MIDDAQRVGFDKQTIQTDVELKLRVAGIKVLTTPQQRTTPGNPRLYVNLNYVDTNGVGAYNIEVALQQTVLLSRDQTVTTYGVTTWSASRVGIGPRDRIVSAVRSRLGDCLNEFLNAYLAVNPKK